MTSKQLRAKQNRTAIAIIKIDKLASRFECDHSEAILLNIERDHTTALKFNYELLQALLSHKEICAQKRRSAYETTSIFTNSINESSSAYQIEILLIEFHTESELYKLMNTSEMLEQCNTSHVKRSRIRAHLSHLKRKFSQTVRFIEKREDFKVYFKFELK